MTFKDQSRNPRPSPYGRQVGARIVALPRLLQDKVTDQISARQVLNVALSNDWSRAHAPRSQVRSRLLLTSMIEDPVRLAHYRFEESCLETLYNDKRSPLIHSVRYRPIGLGRTQSNLHGSCGCRLMRF